MTPIPRGECVLKRVKVVYFFNNIFSIIHLQGIDFMKTEYKVVNQNYDRLTWVLVCSSHSIIFHSFGDVAIDGEGIQILTYVRHLWPLSCEGSLACHTYCDTGHPFVIVISENP